MAAWTELIRELQGLPDDEKGAWLERKLFNALQEIGRMRGNRNVLFYGSAFLQKPFAPPHSTQLTHEELNGFMSCLFGMQWDRGLTLILHTPGGVTNAAETIVQYLLSKFPEIEVIVPTFAMSAGTMISLASDRIVMGRQSQLGPIDPQMPINGKYVSARAIVDQFKTAKGEISQNLSLAHVWAPILSSLGPALLEEAQNALEYGERMVGEWLAARMFKDKPDPKAIGEIVAKYFNAAEKHKSHGRRIGRDEARDQGVIIEDLEDDQNLQDVVLTAYHLMTILFEQSAAVKIIYSNHGQTWIKNAPSA